MSTPTSSWARYATAFAVFVLFGLAVWGAERLVAYRDPGLLWRDPQSGDDGLKFYRFDPVLGLFHEPGLVAEYRGVTYTANTLGARGPELPYERVDGRRRVVVLGDSLVWGFGVPDGQTLCDSLARALPDTDVVNLGVAGYGTGQELMLLRHEGVRYEPDHVLLVFTLANDVEDSYFPDSASSYPANLFYLEDGELAVDRFETTRLERFGLWLAHESYLVAWSAQQFGDAGGAGPKRSAIGRSNRARLDALAPDLSRYAQLSYLEPEDGADRAVRYARRGGPLRPDALNHYKVELVKQLIRAIADESLANGAAFTVALAPYAAQLDDAAPDPLAAELSRFLSAEGIEFVDLRPLLQAGGAPAGRLYLDSVHFSRTGNQKVAERLAPLLGPRDPR